MRDRRVWATALVMMATWPMAVRAQIPALPPVAGMAAPGAASALGGVPAVPAVPAAAAAPPSTLWSSLGLSKASIHACQAKICASQFGQMLGSFMGGPLQGFTGGFIPSICPSVPTAAQMAGLGNQPGGAAAAAAAIKASEAGAKARVAAVEYLGTVDCSRWPEARKSLGSSRSE